MCGTTPSLTSTTAASANSTDHQSTVSFGFCPAMLLFLRHRGRLRHFDFEEFTALGLVGLSANRSGHLESFAFQQIGRTPGSHSVIGNRNDGTISRDFREVLLQVRQLDAEVHRKT